MTASERKVLLVAGAAAGMTAIFGTPIAAVLLAVELMLFVVETGVPAPKTGLPAGTHTPELRFVVDSSW